MHGKDKLHGSTGGAGKNTEFSREMSRGLRIFQMLHKTGPKTSPALTELARHL